MVGIQQDILTVSNGVIVHQVSLRCVMGAGLAKQIRERWPIVYSRYHRACVMRELKLGLVQFIPVADYSLWVANLVGQEDVGTGRQHTDYAAVRKGLLSISVFSGTYGLPVYIPYKMGCGLGGGDWSIVRYLVEEIIPNAFVCRLEE